MTELVVEDRGNHGDGRLTDSKVPAVMAKWRVVAWVARDPCHDVALIGNALCVEVAQEMVSNDTSPTRQLSLVQLKGRLCSGRHERLARRTY